jgi:hypothetical protein
MRQHLNLATEAFAPGPMISLEEEQLLIAETTEDAAAVAKELQDAEQVVAVSDALEDLAVITEPIAELSPTEAALVDTTAAMAVAGKDDMESSMLVPATESYIGKRLATESIKGAARTIWESIKRHIKALWEKIESFFHKFFGTMPRLKKTIDDMKKRVEASTGKTNDDKKVKITSGLASLSIDGKVVKSGAEINSGLGDLKKTADFVFKSNADIVESVGTVIADALDAFDPAKAEESCASFVSKFAAKSSGAMKLPTHGSGNASRFPGYRPSYSAPLLGNVSLVARVYTSADGTTTLGKMERMRFAGVQMIKTSEKAITLPNDVEMPVLSVSEMNSILDECRSIVDVIEGYQRGKQLKEINKTKDAISSASDKATAAMAKAENSEDAGEKAAVPYYRALTNFNISYGSWASNPAMQFAQSATMTIRAMLVVVQRSLAGYK